jgi:hypothetical protein
VPFAIAQPAGAPLFFESSITNTFSFYVIGVALDWLDAFRVLVAVAYTVAQTRDTHTDF